MRERERDEEERVGATEGVPWQDFKFVSINWIVRDAWVSWETNWLMGAVLTNHAALFKVTGSEMELNSICRICPGDTYHYRTYRSCYRRGINSPWGKGWDTSRSWPCALHFIHLIHRCSGFISSSSDTKIFIRSNHSRGGKMTRGVIVLCVGIGIEGILWHIWSCNIFAVVWCSVVTKKLGNWGGKKRQKTCLLQTHTRPKKDLNEKILYVFMESQYALYLWAYLKLRSVNRPSTSFEIWKCVLHKCCLWWWVDN